MCEQHFSAFTNGLAAAQLTEMVVFRMVLGWLGELVLVLVLALMYHISAVVNSLTLITLLLHRLRGCLTTFHTHSNE